MSPSFHMYTALQANSHGPDEIAMALSAPDAALALRRLKTRGQNTARDTNKRPRVASEGEPQRKKAEATGTGTPASAPDQSNALLYGVEPWTRGQEKPHAPKEGARMEVEDEGGGPAGRITPEKDVSAEIAAIAAKNEQLQVSVASLKHRFSLRGEETHQLLLGLGALNAVANELAALQKDYHERSTKNAALIQESLVQISNCSAQVDTLKRCRGLTATQLQSFRQECTQEMNRLVSRLGDLAESAYQEPETIDGDEVSCSAGRMNENRLQVERLKEEVCGYRAQFADDRSVATSSCRSTTGPSQQDTTDRINLALTQLDELHAEMFQLKQSLVQENQSFRRHLEELVSRQMAHIRDVQDNETERVHEEMDEIRSGMCGILKDMHRLKERTKYLVPSMARVGPRRSNPNGAPPPQSRAIGTSTGDQNEGRWMSTPSANAPNAGYSMTMASRQCHDEFPHYEHGFDDDCYCPGVLPSQMEAQYPPPDHPRSPRSSRSSQDEDNWRMEDVPITDQPIAQRCQSPHYSSRSSSLSGRLSVYGEEHVVPNDERGVQQCEQRLLEQHRLFWIGEGAG